MNPKLLLLVSLFAVAGLSAGRADVSGSLSVEIRVGKALPPPPPEVVVVDPVGPAAPPPWAEHHWFRKTRVYYYYPDGDVYYRPADRTWFYLDGGSWRVGASLPERFVFDVGRSVRLSMQTDRPFIYHQQVVVRYPTGYFSHVRIKGGHGDSHGQESDHGHHDVDHDDHEWGGGKGHDKDKKH
ncbi:MAG TPA: hypothetical protein VL357_09645 [Rariglobus sp.]|jgi:hypothetical protein|nr:hypothetical protein [Rariglobus sp.]